MIEPPRWTREELEQYRARAVEAFRHQRMQEPLEDYLEVFDRYRVVMENLLEASADLAQLDNAAIEILTKSSLLEAFRYLAGPPVSPRRSPNSG